MWNHVWNSILNLWDFTVGGASQRNAINIVWQTFIQVATEYNDNQLVMKSNLHEEPDHIYIQMVINRSQTPNYSHELHNLNRPCLCAGRCVWNLHQARHFSFKQ